MQHVGQSHQTTPKPVIIPAALHTKVITSGNLTCSAAPISVINTGLDPGNLYVPTRRKAEDNTYARNRAGVI